MDRASATEEEATQRPLYSDCQQRSAATMGCFAPQGNGKAEPALLKVKSDSFGPEQTADEVSFQSHPLLNGAAVFGPQFLPGDLGNGVSGHQSCR